MKIKEIIKANFLWIFYCITIGLGAFMMFLIQPLIGKIITPQYGGVSQVWCLCLLFFQLALLLGYTLTYFLNFLPTRVQGIIYMLLMTISLFFVHIPLGDQWMPKNVESPVMHLLTLLLTYLAVPVILLSTVSIIHQNWFKTITDKNPYHLYSLSNLGSLSALIFYPLLIEPNLSISFTLKLWTVFYWILVIFICISSIILIKSCKNKIIEQKKTENHFPIKKGDYLFWLLLSFLGTGLLISFTNHLTHDIAPVPLFWVIPLSLYLISFILCFSSKNLYNRSVFFISSHFLLALLLIIHITYTYPHILKKFHLFNFGLAFISLPVQIFINLLCLFCLCMICNGEIYKSRPHPNHLALFYLIIAFGGALGGIFVNIIAPNIYNKYLEFPLLIFIVVTRHQV